MENKYKVSIIIPVYNAEKYLRECMDSLINQTMKNIEIITVNDGSTDNSLKILQEYAKVNNNIKVISQKNQGAIAARIEGYRAASGDYIGFVDNDDFIEKNMYERLYKNAISIDADIAICNYKFYPKNVKNKKKWFNEYCGTVDYKFVKRNNLLWNKIVRKDYLERLNITDLFDKVGESAYTIALINTDKIITINEELYNYRVGQTSLSSDLKNISWHEKGVENAISKYEIIANTELEEKWSDFFKYSIFYSVFKMLLVSAYNSNKELYNKYKQDIKIYKNNEYCKKSFEDDYGKIKSFILFNTIFKSYYLTKLMTKIL